MFDLVVLDQALCPQTTDATLGAHPQTFADFLEIFGALIQFLINLLVSDCLTDAYVHTEQYSRLSHFMQMIIIII